MNWVRVFALFITLRALDTMGVGVAWPQRARASQHV